MKGPSYVGRVLRAPFVQLKGVSVVDMDGDG